MEMKASGGNVKLICGKMDGSYASDLDHTLHVLRSRPPADFGSFPGRLGFSRRGLRKNTVSEKS